MIAYNALEDYQKIKEFESYLLIKQRIEHECTDWLHTILTTLKSVFHAGGTENDLMEVFRNAKN